MDLVLRNWKLITFWGPVPKKFRSIFFLKKYFGFIVSKTTKYDVYLAYRCGIIYIYITDEYYLRMFWGTFLGTFFMENYSEKFQTFDLEKINEKFFFSN